MSARAKIEWVTNSWYGFAFASALVGLLSGGLGIWSMFTTGFSLFVSLGFIWFFGKSLLARSSMIRMFLLVASGIGLVLGVLALGKTAMLFLATWKLKLILQGIVTFIWIGMLGRSLRTLRDAEVKAYIKS